ncbi:phage tail protein [Chitinolyticbacter albus]|uniref:phage tail protein n=1 Tax=Chitinolyticbacter albus TaxID=2961951 RepID=UPI0021096EEC|nr:phage tail protein [Chitinolyticbacter albus]
MADDLLFMRTYRFRVRFSPSPEVAAGAVPAPDSGGLEPALDTPPEDTGGDEIRAPDGAFQEISGLEVSMDVADYNEGGRNDGVIRRAGRARYSPITMKRGMFHPDGDELQKELWQWLQAVVSGRRPIPRFDGVIEVLAANGDDVVATWSFERALPLKVRGPELNAKTGEIAIEELQIAHEGLRLE